MRGRLATVRGFTLIELLVALAIFGVLALLAYGGLSSMLNTRALTDDKADALRDVQLAYRSLERDIDDWVPRGIRNEFGQDSPALAAGEQLGVAFELTRGGWRNPADQTRSTLQRVAYGIRDKQLLRSTWPSLDRAPSAAPIEQELLEGVTELRLRFLGTNAVWLENWPPQGQASVAAANVVVPPPRAIEIVLVTERWGELRWLFRLPG